MNISQVIQLPEGEVNFQGQLTQEEADMIIKAGLITLLRRGAFNVSQEGEEALKQAQKAEEAAQGHNE